MRDHKVILNFFSLIFLSNCFSCMKGSTTKDKCYVLALEGGGSKGAYHAGVIKGLVDNLPAEDVNWDIITGISVGGMNCLALSLFPPGEEKAAANYITELWKSIQNERQIYQKWPWGYLEGLYFRSGLYDNSPLRSLLKNYLKNLTPQRKFVIGATEYESSKYVTWDETSLSSSEDLIDAVISSGTFPSLFPLFKFKNNSHIDGGAKMTIDISSGINRCLDMGYKEENIIVDAVLIIQRYDYHDANVVSPIGVISRVLDLYIQDALITDLEFIIKLYPNVKYRYIVSPSKAFPPQTVPINFIPKDIEIMIEYGIEDALDAINKGWGVNLDNLTKIYYEEKMILHGRRNKK